MERDVMCDVTTRCQAGSRSALIGIGGAGYVLELTLATDDTANHDFMYDSR